MKFTIIAVVIEESTEGRHQDIIDLLLDLEANDSGYKIR